ncbi:hypothetical protein [Streptomyces sp. NPDC001978]|uniref:hypothetical protein n=1 Tax=Streptomyces sp. NPDC001978 TaxID=3364627 RepID=UPI00368009EB
MLALRLIRVAHPAVHLRRLLVATAAAGTGFLLLCALGYAMGHPETPTASVVRLAWCAVPLAATVQLALAVARTDPGTKPRPGLSALGLGPARLMAISVLTTALSCTLGSTVALLVFLHLRGDITGLPFDGAATESLAANTPLPVPAALTLLILTPATASLTVAGHLRPRDPRTHIRRPAGNRAAGAAAVPQKVDTSQGPGSANNPPAAANDTPDSPDVVPNPHAKPQRTPNPSATLPWGIAMIAAGLAVESYAERSATPSPTPGLPGEATGVLVGWLLTALGLILAAPGLTHLCGQLLQSAQPGALRLLAGRILMSEATRLGRPLGLLCAVASGAYAMIALYPLSHGDATSVGPLTALGALVVTGCAVATLLTTAVETRQSRAETVAALVRLGAPATMLRSAAALRAGALLALFTPLTLVIAELAALPLAH